jgi:hypothetical protein
MRPILSKAVGSIPRLCRSLARGLRPALMAREAAAALPKTVKKSPIAEKTLRLVMILPFRAL